ncbi:MAG: magnesium and cobalt transport protein CorA [Planctomycetes bacterium RBG_13_62_9]|nr:MAG: magnesium and cobalt transport protein CorA [Planctomycetes bacterium RBG_13_62_9]
MANKTKRRNGSLSRRAKKAGLPPGSLVQIGEQNIETVRITCMDYDEQGFQETCVTAVEECFHFKNTASATWINVDGIHDISIVEKIGKAFEIHPLILEDIVTAGQRPKYEGFAEYGYIVLTMLNYFSPNTPVETEQMSIVFGSNFVISFQERAGDVFDVIRDRIRTGKGRVRKMGPDFLAYSLIDAVVDSYFTILEGAGDRIEVVEEELIARPTEQTLRQIHALKREMLSLRRSVWPLRELVSAMQRDESPLIAAQTRIYLRDVYDHTIHIIDAIEGFRDVLSGMLDIYLSSISNRTNAIMKVLTIIATIFIPLTFIAGVYGMNFEYMPGLHHRWGYPVALLLMVAVAVVMLVYFRRRRWL